MSRNDLFYDDYTWTSGSNDNPDHRGNPDSALLNRTQGYEMLHFLNNFNSKYGPFSVSYLQRIEKHIRGTVPTNIRSRIEIEQVVCRAFLIPYKGL